MISKNQMKFIRQLGLKKYRNREGLFVAEGNKVVGDLLRNYKPHAVFATDEWLKANAAWAEGHSDDVVQVLTPDELQRVSFLQHPQQVLALFAIPEANTSGTDVPQTALSIALDGVQDPGNLGTIIRIADWFGIDTIFCSLDTVDVYNPKVVQATMGSIARVRLVYTDLVTLLDTLPPEFPVYGTLLDGESIYAQQLTTEGLIVMGNEGNGLSQEVRERINRRLLIPNFRPGDTAESLNVAIATAITVSEFRRGL